jgi:transcription elongation GreA/GreB family factor
MPEKLILSTVSAWALGNRFEETVAQKNEAMREARIAKQDGDLSENAPYQAAKEKFRTMGRIQRRLTKEMNDLLSAGHRVVDPLSWVTDAKVSEADIGVVTLLERAGNKDPFLIAGARDHHIPEDGNIIPIPYTSPLGKVLMGRIAGEHFSVPINGETQSIKVLELRRPTRPEILAIFPSLKEEGTGEREE